MKYLNLASESLSIAVLKTLVSKFKKSQRELDYWNSEGEILNDMMILNNMNVMYNLL